MGEVKGIKSLGVALLMAGMVTQAGTLAAQEVKHLNPVIEKLAAGKAIIGFQTGDLTLGNARTMSRADADYVYVDMEHTPLDFPALNQFAMGMVDKATALKKGSPAPNMALFARFPPYGREGAQWIAKQALDAGLMGVIFNGVDTPEQALVAVQNMRYPQQRTSKYQNPTGLRGYGPAAAAWVWGISIPEYERRADVWPLNPDGDLIAIMMIESTEGIKNADAIAAVPWCHLPWCRQRSPPIARRRGELTGDRAGLSDHLAGLPRSQRGVRHHGNNGTGYRAAARRRMEDDPHDQWGVEPMARFSISAVAASAARHRASTL
jgi:2-keto-3-deoxy-L-rhamnonate aldolase RhmA